MALRSRRRASGENYSQFTNKNRTDKRIGKSNMTLETVSKLEQALSFDLIGKSLQEFNYSMVTDDSIGYLNDSSVSGPAPEGVKTSELVNGYKPRKKKGPKSPKRP